MFTLWKFSSPAYELYTFLCFIFQCKDSLKKTNQPYFLSARISPLGGDIQIDHHLLRLVLGLKKAYYRSTNTRVQSHLLMGWRKIREKILMEFIYYLSLVSSIHDKIHIGKTRISRLDSSAVVACLEDKMLLKKAKIVLKISFPSGNLLIIVCLVLLHFWHGWVSVEMLDCGLVVHWCVLLLWNSWC